jgi:hypothetical protein
MFCFCVLAFIGSVGFRNGERVWAKNVKSGAEKSRHFTVLDYFILIVEKGKKIIPVELL